MCSINMIFLESISRTNSIFVIFKLLDYSIQFQLAYIQYLNINSLISNLLFITHHINYSSQIKLKYTIIMFFLQPQQEKQQATREFRSKQLKEVFKAAILFGVLKLAAIVFKPKKA
ncbi:unnamed protein product (macronuclear) [Paramecium tetraurelia]|uniref:Transmembrane protein n=1 Tax=Paramecium tetraurelia TaxID=5888 RepID=A0C7Y6_PARTE|nr:uncharacterized protein GSPATT00036034001 [Paramecium tetraurelia]CAK66903.1 unnamed protein product [Paramecium tetraurelia]|eukprot:XP_001434300.1 hypothetical protein (macronuclear) [Paramecium tetraurelia strain d4-2]